jgi:hypothetical protein
MHTIALVRGTKLIAKGFVNCDANEVCNFQCSANHCLRQLAVDSSCAPLLYVYAHSTHQCSDSVANCQCCEYIQTGEMRLMLRRAPLKTENEMFSVLPSDLRAWLLYGLMEEDSEIKQANEVVAALQQEVAAIDKRLERVAYTKQVLT